MQRAAFLHGLVRQHCASHLPMRCCHRRRTAKTAATAALRHVVLAGVEHGGLTAKRAAELQQHVEEDGLAILRSPEIGFGRETELSVTLCDDSFIRNLNREYLGKDRPTDVLSFPLADDPATLFQGRDPVDDGDELDEVSDDEAEPIGDIVISVDTAAAQAQERSHVLRDELRLLLVHGVLHLVGYDHERSAEEHHAMAAKEAQVLNALSWPVTGLLEASDE